MLRQRSINSFIEELERCEALRLKYLVSHPGNFMDDPPSGLARNNDRLAAVGKIIETPKLDDAETTDRRMLERLRSYIE